MDSDLREVIRRRIELRERDGHERLLLNHVDLRALLDACDERDRIKAELGDPSRHYIMDGWLVIDTGRHTCGTGPGGHYGAHEPGCGLEQALRLDNLQGWPGDERDRLAGNRREPRDLDWDRSVDSYHAAGWVDEPGDYERMFFESGWRSAIRALEGSES